MDQSLLNYFTKQIKLHQLIIEYLDETKHIEEKFSNCQTFLNDDNILENQSKFSEFIHLLIKISNDHYSDNDIFEKIVNLINPY